MSYHIYSTEGIILKRTPQGEANVVLHVLTEKLGLIIASARSARLAISKLRPALQEYESVGISCIKSKNGWKITNVVGKESFYFDAPDYSQKVLAQISSILLRTITGELPHPKIFQTVKSGFKLLKSLSGEDASNLEVLMALRVLHELGYVGSSPGTSSYLENLDSWDKALLSNVAKGKKEIVEIINRAIKESHL